MFIDLNIDRSLLRCNSYDDIEFFYKEFSNDNVNRYLYDVEPCTSANEAKQWIDFYLEPEPRNQHRWIIILKSTNESTGTFGFHCWNKETGEVEIGYDLFPTYWRKGYATEALEKIIEYAKNTMHINKIYVHISIDNISSIKTVLKQGLVKIGESYYEEFRGKRYLHDVYERLL